MMGKSSTVNSLFNESVVPVTSFQQDTARPQIHKRTAAGFEMSVIDTPGLLDSDAVSTAVRHLVVVTAIPASCSLGSCWLDFVRLPLSLCRADCNTCSAGCCKSFHQADVEHSEPHVMYLDIYLRVASF